MNNLPFVNTGDCDMLNCNGKLEQNCNSIFPLSNNDQLDIINPDINIFSVNNQNICKNYDTSQEFNDKYGLLNNIAIIHSNICSYEKELSDFTYYLDNLGITFSFIELCVCVQIAM